MRSKTGELYGPSGVQGQQKNTNVVGLPAWPAHARAQVRVQSRSPCLERAAPRDAPAPPALCAQVPQGSGDQRSAEPAQLKRRPLHAAGLGECVRRAEGKQGPGGRREHCPNPANSLTGFLGLSPIPEKRWGPAAPPRRAGPAPPAHAERPAVCAPGLELLVIAAPAEVAARGPAPQEGLQLVDRRPLCAPPPPPLLPTLVLRLVPALLPPALLLHGLLFLLGGGGRAASPGGWESWARPAQGHPGGLRERVYLSALLLLLLLLLRGRPALLICTDETQPQLPVDQRPGPPRASRTGVSLGVGGSSRGPEPGSQCEHSPE